jgi:hypothetical protein
MTSQPKPGDARRHRDKHALRRDNVIEDFVLAKETAASAARTTQPA